MSKHTEALKLALHHIEAGAHNRRYIRHVIREALAEESSGTEQPAQQDLPDLIAGALGVSRGTAYDLMREALAEQPAQDEDQAHYKQVVDGVREAFDAKRKQQPAQQQEPVAWRTKNAAPPGGYVLFQQYPKAVADLGGKIEPLYTSPLAQRKPLTDEEIDKLPWEPHEGNPMTFAEGLRYFARAIEAAHGIKENK